MFMCEAKMYFRSFFKLNSHLKMFFVIRVSNCCSASIHQFIWWLIVTQSSETCVEGSGKEKSKQREQLKNDTEKRTSLLCSPG